MKIHFVGHACIVAECADTSILMDPWLFGKIFNDSWSLLPEPNFDEAMLDKIDYIWLSHEHPDHCHFPTLDSFPAPFKARVTILFQDRDYTKVFAALRKIGYQRFKRLPHRVVVPLSDKPDATKVYCYHAGLMDSALAVLGQRQVIFNANDARISVGECKGILADIEQVDVLLSQFSLAAYAGFEPHEKYLPQRAKQILENVSSVHRALTAKVTIPFASFMYFSSLDNKYVNNFVNSARHTDGFLRRHGQRTAVLYPGDTLRGRRRTRFIPRAGAIRPASGRRRARLLSGRSKTMAEIVAAYESLAANMRERYSMLLLRMLRRVTIGIPDLEQNGRVPAGERFARGNRRLDRAGPGDQLSAALVWVQVPVRHPDAGSIGAVQVAAQFQQLETPPYFVFAQQRRSLSAPEISADAGNAWLHPHQAGRRIAAINSLLSNLAVTIAIDIL